MSGTLQERVVPASFGPLRHANANVRQAGYGDTVEFWLAISEDRVERVSFTTDGCELSLLACRLTADRALGRTLSDVEAITDDDILAAAGDELPAEDAHCAVLAVSTLKAAVAQYRQTCTL